MTRGALTDDGGVVCSCCRYRCEWFVAPQALETGQRSIVITIDLQFDFVGRISHDSAVHRSIDGSKLKTWQRRLDVHKTDLIRIPDH